MKFTDHLPPAAKAQYKTWCSKGGKAGSRRDKVRAAKVRWAKQRKEQKT